MDITVVYNIAMFPNNVSSSYFPHQRWSYPKENERNFVASFFHAVSITLLSSALVHMVWFRIYGSSDCTPYILVNQFFTFGYFEMKSVKPDKSRYTDTDDHSKSTSTSVYYSSNQVLTCITPQVVLLIRLVIMLCISAIFTSSIGFCLDVIGPKSKFLRTIRQNCLPSIITVVLVVAAVGVCYLVATSLQMAALKAHGAKEYTSIQVTYEFGYYTITIAAAVSILATACNLLQSGGTPPEEVQRHRLIEELDAAETFAVGMRNMPEPPPPYTP